MKKLTLIVLIFCAQLSYSQTDEDYEKVVSNLIENFNSQNASGIHELFSPEYKASYAIDDLKKLVETTKTEKGVISETSLLTQDEAGAQFLVEFTEASSLFILMLNNNGLLTKFELGEY